MGVVGVCQKMATVQFKFGNYDKPPNFTCSIIHAIQKKPHVLPYPRSNTASWKVTRYR